MSAATLFSAFRENLKVANAADISTKYNNITARLNLDFWDVESSTLHSLQIGSYGRRTAINGISDLDMVFELPLENLARYKKLTGNGPSVMLQEVRASLLKRYPTSDVVADGQIVGVNFTGYRVEVLPAFKNDDGDYIHGDTNDGGSWKTTMPRPEIKAVNDLDTATNGNLKIVCKMLRAWKNKMGVGIGGLLIDTLAYNFFSQTDAYDDAIYKDYPALCVSLFAYLANLDDQEYWMAPGSNQRVRRKAKFQAKARKAAVRCQKAVAETSERKQADLWRQVFGRQFPKSTEVVLEKEATTIKYRDPEQFIEDQVPVDIRNTISLECEEREGSKLLNQLRTRLRQKQKVPFGRRLRFYIAGHDIPGDFEVRWKVRNRPTEPKNYSRLRGEIELDGGAREKIETADFAGDHYVEAYAIKNGVCIARERIRVPI